MGFMGFIWTVVVGLIVGAIARWIMPGGQSMGWIMTSLLGIGGSIVGGFVSSLIWKSPDGRFQSGRLDHVNSRCARVAVGLHEPPDVDMDSTPSTGRIGRHAAP